MKVSQMAGSINSQHLTNCVSIKAVLVTEPTVLQNSVSTSSIVAAVTIAGIAYPRRDG